MEFNNLQSFRAGALLPQMAVLARLLRKDIYERTTHRLARNRAIPLRRPELCDTGRGLVPPAIQRSFALAASGCGAPSHRCELRSFHVKGTGNFRDTPRDAGRDS